jgi:hypothetical protein
MWNRLNIAGKWDFILGDGKILGEAFFENFGGLFNLFCFKTLFGVALEAT